MREAVEWLFFISMLILAWQLIGMLYKDPREKRNMDYISGVFDDVDKSKDDQPPVDHTRRH